jgi:hypothetical protein
MIERRAFDRIPVNQLALLAFDGIRGTHPATVQNISAVGACISVSYCIFAHEFQLSFDGFRKSYTCRVVWRKETLCGVSFVARGYGRDWDRGLPRSVQGPFMQGRRV